MREAEAEAKVETEVQAEVQSYPEAPECHPEAWEDVHAEVDTGKGRGGSPSIALQPVSPSSLLSYRDFKNFRASTTALMPSRCPS